MRIVRLLVAAGLVLLFPLTLAQPASAGGPTSALLVAPGSHAVGLYHLDSEYEKLRALVDVGTSSTSAGEDGASHAEGPFVTVTWMIHDVQVWRVDRIYYEADGGPWIHTLENQYNQRSVGVWHRSPHPDRLADLLQQLKLTDGEYAGPLASPAFVEGPVERVDPRNDATGSGNDTQESAAVTNDREPPTTDASASGWWWAGGGLLAGAMLAGVVVWLYPIVRSSQAERQQLVDS